MRKLFVIFFLSSPYLWAHEQVVKPVRADFIFDTIKDHLVSKVDRIRKKSSGHFLVTPEKINFESLIACELTGRRELGGSLWIEREVSEQKIIERMILSGCGKRAEIFELERRGTLLAPTSNNDLLKGNVPHFQGLDFYDLKFLDRRFHLRLRGQNEKLRMDLDVVERGFAYNYDFQFSFDEIHDGKTLIHQFLTLRTFRGPLIKQNFSTEYKWSLDSRYQIPRQYLYFNNQEVSPHTFNLVLADFFTEFFFPFLKSEFDYNPLAQ